MRTRGPRFAGLFLLGALASDCKRDANVRPSDEPRPAASAMIALPDGGSAVVLSAPPAVVPLLRHPALTKVREFVLGNDWRNAAETLSMIRTSQATPPGGSELDRCALAYVEGRYFARVPDPRAIAAFDAVPEACLVFPDAQLRAANLLVEDQKFELALQHLARTKVPDVYAPEEKRARAQALFALGRRNESLVALRELEKDGKLKSTPELVFELSTLLLDTCQGDCVSEAREADSLALHLVLTAPKFAEKRNVADLRRRAHEKLRTEIPSLTDSERLTELQAWIAADSTGGRKRAEDLFRTWATLKIEPALYCRLATARAHSLPKKKSAAAWEDAIRLCTGSPELPGALYNGAKAQGAAKNEPRALELYERLEKDFATHRLADDARFLRGLRVLEHDIEAGIFLLSRLADDFPEGDMRGDALFRAALARMTTGDWKAAAPLLERMRSVATPLARVQADYFAARCKEEMGDQGAALVDYERIVREAPLTYYMALAFSRLSQADAARGDKLMREVIRGEAITPLTLTLSPEWKAPLERPVRLLELGDFEHAKIELRDFSREDAPTDQQLLTSALFISAGAFDLGHQLVRSRLKEHAVHFPSEGRYRFLWSLQYPDAFRSLVEAQAEKRALPKALSWGIMREESTFVVEAKSPADAFGLMQLIVPTACGIAGDTPFACPAGTLQHPEPMEATLRRADASITLGTKLLAGLRQRFAKNPHLAIPAYNAGAGAVDRWLSERATLPFDLFVESIPYDETRNYTKHVLASQLAYGELYDSSRPNEVLALPLKTEP